MMTAIGPQSARDVYLFPAFLTPDFVPEEMCITGTFLSVVYQAFEKGWAGEINGLTY